MRLRKANRVRIHLTDPKLPSVEGLLLSRRHRELAVGVPELITEAVTAGGRPTTLESRLLIVPLDRVAFYEVI
jgi:hypothetical protein